MLPACAGSLLGTSRVLTSLIRLLPVPPPRPPASPRAPFHTSGTSHRRHTRAVADGDAAEVADGAAALPLKKKRRRLDEVCLELYPQYSRNVLQSWIAQGKVLVNDRAVTKAGTPVPATAAVVLTAEQPKFVCRAGLKMEAALDRFNIDPTGLAILDSGLSTGGFTDCLLQRGAASVVGVDVGYGQVADKVRLDPRVTVMERTNLRHLRRGDLPRGAAVDAVTLDLSFISSLKMRDAVCDVLAPGGQLVLLIKPQFEAGKAEVGTGGVVRDAGVRAAVVAAVVAGWEEAGFECSGTMESPIKGATAGNIEYLAHFVWARPGAWAGGGGGGAVGAEGDDEEV